MAGSKATRAARAFTIVELLVVISIIGVLMGLLVVGLKGAYATTRKTQELAHLRAVGATSLLHGDSNNDSMPTGFSEAHLYPETACITCQGDGPSDAIPCRLTGVNTTSLASYLGQDFSTFWAELGLDPTNYLQVRAQGWATESGTLPHWLAELVPLRASAYVLQPSFGYNGFYLGGWNYVAGACKQFAGDAHWTDENGTLREGDLVVRKSRTIRHPERLIMYCSSTYRPVGRYKHSSAGESSAVGCAWVCPPLLGTTQMWGMGLGTLQGLPSTPPAGFFDNQAPSADLGMDGSVQSDVIQVAHMHGVPIRRHTRQAALVHCDGSVTTAGAAELMDMRRWIDKAWKADFHHTGAAPP